MRWFALAAFTLLILATLPSSVSAQADASITIEAHGSEQCSDGKTYCFQVASGSLANLEAGMSVEVTFRNEDSVNHELLAANRSDADPDHSNTRAADAFGQTREIGRNQEVTKIFEVPDGAEGIYLWCDISGHESLGMWLSQGFGQGDGGSMDGGDGPADGGDAQNGSPLPAVALLLALIAAALVTQRVET